MFGFFVGGEVVVLGFGEGRVVVAAGEGLTEVIDASAQGIAKRGEARGTEKDEDDQKDQD